MLKVVSKVLREITYGNYWMIRISIFTPSGSCDCTSIKNLTNKLSEVFDSVLSFSNRDFLFISDKIIASIKRFIQIRKYQSEISFLLKQLFIRNFVVRNLPEKIECMNTTIKIFFRTGNNTPVIAYDRLLV